MIRTIHGRDIRYEALLVLEHLEEQMEIQRKDFQQKIDGLQAQLDTLKAEKHVQEG